MKITLLGTGDAAGVPVWSCGCSACDAARANPALRRGPCSAMVELGDTRVLLDAGLMDLASRFRREELSAIVLTHFHADHVQGLFHLRWGRGEPLTVFCPADDEGCADLYHHPGLLAFRPVTSHTPFTVGDFEITPLPLPHSKPTFGYLIEGNGRAAYLTDTRGLSENSARALKHFAPEVVVIDAKYPPGHPMPKNHNTLDEAAEIGIAAGAGRVILTHLGHDADRWLIENPGGLCEGTEVGHDNQTVFTADNRENP